LIEAKGLTTELTKDEEYEAYELGIKFQVNGMVITCKINLALVQSPEYKISSRFIRSSRNSARPTRS